MVVVVVVVALLLLVMPPALAAAPASARSFFIVKGDRHGRTAGDFADGRGIAQCLVREVGGRDVGRGVGTHTAGRLPSLMHSRSQEDRSFFVLFFLAPDPWSSPRAISSEARQHRALCNTTSLSLSSCHTRRRRINRMRRLRSFPHPPPSMAAATLLLLALDATTFSEHPRCQSLWSVAAGA